MRFQPRLEDEQKSCAILVYYLVPSHLLSLWLNYYLIYTNLANIYSEQDTLNEIDAKKQKAFNPVSFIDLVDVYCCFLHDYCNQD